MKFGADVGRYQRNFYQSQATAGFFLFSGQFTQHLQAGAARNVIDDPLLGLPVYRQEDALPNEDPARLGELGEFIADDYRVRIIPFRLER